MNTNPDGTQYYIYCDGTAMIPHVDVNCVLRDARGWEIRHEPGQLNTIHIKCAHCGSMDSENKNRRGTCERCGAPL